MIDALSGSHVLELKCETTNIWFCCVALYCMFFSAYEKLKQNNLQTV